MPKKGQQPKYKIKPVEQRGKFRKEPKVCTSFWKDNKMSDVEFLTAEELDIFLDNWYELYETRLVKIDRLWNYPEDPLTLDKKYEKQYNRSNKG